MNNDSDGKGMAGGSARAWDDPQRLKPEDVDPKALALAQTIDHHYPGCACFVAGSELSQALKTGGSIAFRACDCDLQEEVAMLARAITALLRERDEEIEHRDMWTALWKRAEAAEERAQKAEIANRQRRSEAEDALRGLTPGGSEFQTPEECVAFVRADRESARRTMLAFRLRADKREEGLRLALEFAHRHELPELKRIAKEALGE